MLACIKIYLYAALQGAFSTLVVSVLVSYAVVACIHLFFTGYAVYGLRAKFWFWWDWNEYLNGKGHRVEWFRRHEIVLWRGQDGKEVAEPNSARRIVAVQQANDADAPERSGQLSIELEAVNNKPHHVLYTWGVLTDELLDSLLNMQETSRREAVAVNGVNHQLIILDEDPVKPVRSGGDKEEEHNDAR